MVAFNPKTDIPDLTGKVIIVTGGNVGIGYETCKVLLSKNATVFLAARSEDKATAAIEQLQKDTGKAAIFLKLDLSDLTKIKAAAEEFKSKADRLDVLYLNAGVMRPPMDQLTPQGYDLQFGTNVIGHYLFQKLLLPTLESTSTSSSPTRVVWLSSEGHKLAPGTTGIEWDSMKDGAERNKWIADKGTFKGPWALYGQSKLGNMLLANHLARTQSGKVAGITVHPGVVSGTSLSKTTPGWQKWLMSWISVTNEQGAYASLYAGVGSKVEEVNGKYCVPLGKVGKADKKGSDEKVQDELVKWLDEQVAPFA